MTRLAAKKDDLLELEANPDFSELERQIGRFWREKKIRETYLLKNRSAGKRFSFLDGPITANNPMAIHHGWGRTLKDLFQRFFTLRGFKQRYQNGFDCQGLWVEVEVEKELGLKSKKEIENLVAGDVEASIAKFVQFCKDRVIKYAKIQTEQSLRLGQWMAFDDEARFQRLKKDDFSGAGSYYTFDPKNNQAIWHFLKVCHERGLIYKGADVVPWCVRCGTAISQHEILTEEYRQVVHTAAYVRYPIVGRKGEYLLIWTTTPWTLPANSAIAVDPNLEYVKVRDGGSIYYLLKARVGSVLPKARIVESLPRAELVGLKYRGHFDHLPAVKAVLTGKDHRVLAARDLVSEKEGTGLVHIAPGAGREDYQIGKSNGLSVLSPLDEAGRFTPGFEGLSGLSHDQASERILGLLSNDIVLKESFSHRYPTCWRCGRELVFRLVDEWYIKMAPLRADLSAAAKTAKWLPDWGLKRELDWLKNMDDWLISKKRYWGLALPIYECSCGRITVVGSLKELKEKAVAGWSELKGRTPHRPYIDKVEIRCDGCGRPVSRIADVGNPWLDAGIVGISTLPEDWRPADFVVEALPGQFKNWFYSLLTMSVVLEGRSPFKTLLGHGLVRDAKGREMHKSASNAVSLEEIEDRVGIDAARWFFAQSRPEENLNFDFDRLEKIERRFFLILWNSVRFYLQIRSRNFSDPTEKEAAVLDRFIVSRLNQELLLVEKSLTNFEARSAALSLERFLIFDLSQWYLRRSRKRTDKSFQETLYRALKTSLILLSPFVPHLSERLYQAIKRGEDSISVHLGDWPKAGRVDDKLIKEMAKVRALASALHLKRDEAGIKLRQPLEKAYIPDDLPQELVSLLKDEVNVLAIEVNSRLDLQTELTDELLALGWQRELKRAIQALRKKVGLKLSDKALLKLEGLKTDPRILLTERLLNETNVELAEEIDDPASSEVLIGDQVIRISLGHVAEDL